MLYVKNHTRSCTQGTR